jgi:RNA polymerase sigma factor (sigma-70 family)
MSKTVPQEETKFIEGIRAGDQAMIKWVYTSHYSIVKNYILKNKGQEDDARDVYQESMTILCRNLQHEPGFVLTCSIRTFLYAVARRLWLKHLRDSNRNGVLHDGFDVEDEVQTGVHWEKESQLDLMTNSMDSLGEPCKTLLYDFYIHKQSMETISEKFGYTNADNAKNQKYKCLQRLKKIFFNQYREKE